MEVDEKGERIRWETAMAMDRDKNKLARGMGKTTASRNENAPSTIYARKHNLPIWAGQSMTTVRLLNMAQWAGGQTLEFNALAQAIFAFWRLEYNHTSDFAYHTFHEVMDMAKNFGVSYKTPLVGTPMEFDYLDEKFIRPSIQLSVDGMNEKIKSLIDQIGKNKWQNQDNNKRAKTDVSSIVQKRDQIILWWQNFKFNSEGNARKQHLTHILKGLNIVQRDIKDLDDFIKIKSSTVENNFDWKRVM